MELSPKELGDIISRSNRGVTVDATPACTDSPLDQLLGQPIFVRTVTHHHTGRLTQIGGGFLVLDEAAWIADDGRFADMLTNGTPNEIEPFADPVYISIGAIIDVTAWRHSLPRNQK